LHSRYKDLNKGFNGWQSALHGIRDGFVFRIHGLQKGGGGLLLEVAVVAFGLGGGKVTYRRWFPGGAWVKIH
jgi:hypothetical protein